jgi:hypothetical protein
MATLGYNDYVACTPVGRFMTIMVAMTGIYVMSIVIAVQTSLMKLDKIGVKALMIETEQAAAIRCVISAIKF